MNTKSNGAVKSKRQVKAESITMTMYEVFQLFGVIGKCNNVGLGPLSFVSYIELMTCVENIIQARAKAIKVLMESYGIKMPEPNISTPGQFVWPYHKHKKKDEIVLKLREINNKAVKVFPANFIPPAEFQVFVSGSQMSQVIALSKILMKK